MLLKVENNIIASAFPYASFKSSDNLRAAAPLTKPIEVIQQTIEDSLDIITQTVDSGKKKKSNKIAIAAGSSVIVIAGLVALFFHPDITIGQQDLSAAGGGF